ncbi:MAG: STAS domain-containing protein [Acidobacteriia bacterium]|nr:STAS domain-containing protein [Terriglobia bacterium]
MPISETCLNIDGARAAQSLQEALTALDTAGGEMVLDFSSVRRVDAGALRAMEKLAAAAGDKAVKVGLRGVNIDVYKALKLIKLASRFSFPA